MKVRTVVARLLHQDRPTSNGGTSPMSTTLVQTMSASKPESSDTESKVLLPAASHSRDQVWQDLKEFNLPHPLDYYVGKDPYPLPSEADREGYHQGRHFAHWMSGLWDYFRISKLLSEAGVTLVPGNSVLDLGCATGRTLRHFACQQDGLDLWGADIKPKNVQWVLKHLPQSIKAVRVTPQARLPLPDASLDLVYAQSVFTHIGEFETAWLAELRRVLKPGGMAYITIHSDRLWAAYDEKTPVFRALKGVSASASYPIDLSVFQSPMPSGRVVFRVGPEVHHVNTFHSIQYVHDVWGRFFKVERIVDEPARVQAEVVLRKP
jgi:ubiquinone/menaquinone biosynthesis C-methylase UbiE